MINDSKQSRVNKTSLFSVIISTASSYKKVCQELLQENTAKTHLLL